MFFQNLGNVCLGILNGSEIGLEELNLIGGRDFVILSPSLLFWFPIWIMDIYYITCITNLLFIVYADISMQDKVMVFENDKNLIGWGPAECSRVPKSRDVSI